LVNSQGAFDHQLQALAKMAVDSLNRELLVAYLGPLTDEQQKLASLGLLELALTKHGVAPQDVAAIMKPLRSLQELRSSGAAHRKGGKWEAATRKLGIDKMSAREAFRAVAAPVAEAFEKLLAVWPKQA
jgi:hypothetical protein